MKYILSFLFLTVVSLIAQDGIKEPGIKFNPKHYVCYKKADAIKIDGILDEKSWARAEWTDYFVDIEGDLKPQPRFKTRAKMLWDNKFLYIAAELEEPQLWGTIKKRDSVIFRDNDFEVFIDPDGDTHKYYELEINALGTPWDLFLVKPYREEGSGAYNSWDIKGLKVGVSLQGTLNNASDTDKGWKCEIAIPWEVLRESYSNESAPKIGEQWRINFSRVQWRYSWNNGRYVKYINPKTNQNYPEDNWVWSPQGIINMHYPEMWGFIQFSGKKAGEGKEVFAISPRENAKWILRKIYYAQSSYIIKNGKYASDIKELGLENLKADGYVWPPLIEGGKRVYSAAITSLDGRETVAIKQDGEVNVYKKENKN